MNGEVVNMIVCREGMCVDLEKMGILDDEQSEMVV
tara:strand:+ start:330 stop:434 length:105 start_codon:yes stop_codon:yes gene_type:complete